MKSQILPNFFIAGVPKAGTSSLHNWLAAHPQAAASLEKETCFFADADSHIFRNDFNIRNGLTEYAQQFPEAEVSNKRVIFESTPAYIYQRSALEVIPTLATNPRCLFVLREPAAQIKSVFSYYQNNWNHIPPALGFHDYLGAVRGGGAAFEGNELAEDPFKHARYLDFLIPWQNALGPGRMKIILFEDLVADPKATTTDVANWLGLCPDFFQGFNFAVENESYRPRSRLMQKLNIAVRSYLPKGAVYTALRQSYRKLNTTKPGKSDTADASPSMIRNHMAGHNAELAAHFDLDLAAWPTE